LKKVEQQEISELEYAQLKQWDLVWLAHEKDSRTLAALQGIYYLLSNPDLKYLEFEPDFGAAGYSPFNRLFEDPMSLRDIMKIARNFFKLRSTQDKSLKTIIKGITEEAASETANFEVEIAPGSMTQIGFKRKNITAIKQSALLSSRQGKVIYWTSKHYANVKADIYQTIKAAISDGSFCREPLNIRIFERHFRYPIYQSKQCYNIILVLDVSNSVKWILNFMEQIIGVLTASASAAKDKLGLIVFNEDRAQIMHYPTINVRHVVGTVNTLAPQGKTPLAEGLNLALQTLEQSRFQVTGMTNAIVLLSDCFPEPITGEHEDQIDEPVCQRILRVCDKIAEAKMKFMVISPYVRGIKNYDKHLGYRLGNLAAERGKGKFLKLMGDARHSMLEDKSRFEVSEQVMKNFSKEVNSFRSDGAFDM